MGSHFRSCSSVVGAASRVETQTTATYAFETRYRDAFETPFRRGAFYGCSWFGLICGVWFSLLPLVFASRESGGAERLAPRCEVWRMINGLS